MTDTAPQGEAEPADNSASAPRGLRQGLAWLKANRERFFWWWVLYQAIKGMITLSLIWVPLLMLWLGFHGAD